MANFNDHLYYGVLTSTISACVGYVQFGLTSVQSGAAFVIGVLASIAPDIDLPSSTPGQLLFTAMGIIAPLAAMLYFPELSEGFRLEHWIVALAGGYIFIRYIVSEIFARITVHRGMFHSSPAILICGQCVFLLFAHLPLQPRITISVIAMLGYLTHLIADEIYSVDWTGKKLKLKKSAGTALDFGRPNQLSTWITYGVSASLGGLMYVQLQPLVS